MSDLRPLQKKAEKAFDQFQEIYGEEMTCQKGCSRCCIAGLGVFSWEAAIISEWVMNLTPPEQKAWLELQSQPQSASQEFLDAGGQKTSPCIFLRNDLCSIYEARPIICRTQGMALQWFNTEEEKQRDWCPLNFQESLKPHPQHDLNLDALNAMSSQAQGLYENEHGQKGAPGPIRVSLAELHSYLLASLS